MKTVTTLLVATAVAFLSASVALGQADQADRDELDQLFAQLGDPEVLDAPRIINRIARIWSRSGSPTADLMLERGRTALAGENYIVAVEHFTALIDHTPEFAEAWNARATAYFLMGEYGLSVSDIAETLKRNPVHFGALAGLGMIYEEVGEPENAYAAYRAAQSVNPHLENVNRAVDRLRLAGIGRAI
ncbi:MAG: tetratricopeptide repeat protein [Pseudomonadota bacterium]